MNDRRQIHTLKSGVRIIGDPNVTVCRKKRRVVAERHKGVGVLMMRTFCYYYEVSMIERARLNEENSYVYAA